MSASCCAAPCPVAAPCSRYEDHDGDLEQPLDADARLGAPCANCRSRCRRGAGFRNRFVEAQSEHALGKSRELESSCSNSALPAGNTTMRKRWATSPPSAVVAAAKAAPPDPWPPAAWSTTRCVRRAGLRRIRRSKSNSARRSLRSWPRRRPAFPRFRGPATATLRRREPLLALGRRRSRAIDFFTAAGKHRRRLSPPSPPPIRRSPPIVGAGVFGLPEFQ